MIRLTAFSWVPPFAQGLVRDLRPRWALEEAGLSYQTELVSQDTIKSDSYRKRQPFGQVPVLEDGDLSLFESGAIVLHIAEKSPALMPKDEASRARARVWVFAALNSIEPHVQNLATIDLFNSDKEWAKERRPEVVTLLKERLANLEAWMKGREYLEGNHFTAADLVMTTVLRILRHTDFLAKDFPILDAHVKRCEARPAFKKALEAQMKVFADNAPA